MREIKFRALGEKSVGIGREARAEKYWNYFKVGEVSVAKFREETTSQFTGLKDKNGKEVYEGDIINVKQSDTCECGNDLAETFEKCEVRWLHEKCASWGWSGNGRWRRFELGDEFEVIGNVYEHPELIKEVPNND